jgi:hypothetical protein
MMAQPDFGAGVDAMDFMDDGREPPQPFGVLAPSQTLPAGHPGAGGARYYTIQRVNGGTSGKENEGGGHKHTLEQSDAIKKNSVRRKMLKEEKEKKRTDVSVQFFICFLVQSGQAGFHLFLISKRVQSVDTGRKGIQLSPKIHIRFVLATSTHQDPHG